MPGLAWSNWFWRDWDSDPGLRLVSFAAQGLWMRMLCIAAASRRPGYVMVADRSCSIEEIARITGGRVGEVSQLVLELEKGGVFSRDAENVIYCRRMVRETERLRQFREDGKKGGRPRKSLNTAAEKPNPTLSKKITLPLALARVPDGSGDGDKILTGSEKVEGTDSVAGFGAFWRLYPRREDKGHAEVAFERALKIVSLDDLMAAVATYAAQRKGQDKKYTALPSTWLNGKRWADEGLVMPSNVTPFGSPGFA